MILPIAQVQDYEATIQQKQALIYKNIKKEYFTQLDHNYRSMDKVSLRNNQEFKYETPYKGKYII